GEGASPTFLPPMWRWASIGFSSTRPRRSASWASPRVTRWRRWPRRSRTCANASCPRRRALEGEAGFMLLYLVRHAQTASSAVDSFNGRSELPLTERGREQARKPGERLSAVRFAAVVRSPLGRARETAELVAPTVPHVVMEGLTEIDYGAWEGLTP